MNLKLFLTFLFANLFILSNTVFAFSPDPFLGEGKQKYIERCISEGEMPGDKNKFCKCIADKLEKGYSSAIKSLKPSDTLKDAQTKMDRIAQAYVEECLKEQ